MAVWVDAIWLCLSRNSLRVLFSILCVFCAVSSFPLAPAICFPTKLVFLLSVSLCSRAISALYAFVFLGVCCVLSRNLLRVFARNCRVCFVCASCFNTFPFLLFFLLCLLQPRGVLAAGHTRLRQLVHRRPHLSLTGACGHQQRKQRRHRGPQTVSSFAFFLVAFVFFGVCSRRATSANLELLSVEP